MTVGISDSQFLFKIEVHSFVSGSQSKPRGIMGQPSAPKPAALSLSGPLLQDTRMVQMSRPALLMTLRGFKFCSGFTGFAELPTETNQSTSPWCAAIYNALTCQSRFKNLPHIRQNFGMALTQRGQCRRTISLITSIVWSHIQRLVGAQITD